MKDNKPFKRGWQGVKNILKVFDINCYVLPFLLLCVLLDSDWGIRLTLTSFSDCSINSIIEKYSFIYILIIPFLLLVIVWILRVQRKFNIYVFCVYVTAVIFICRVPSGNLLNCSMCPLVYALLVFFVVLALFEICRFVKILIVCYKGSKCANACDYGFRIKTEDENVIDVGWMNYVKVLLPLMSATNLDYENFAIGVTGSWGSGKTSFLNTVKKEMAKNFIRVDFSPWYSSTPELIVRDFFNCLGAELYANNIDLDFTQYVGLLQDVDTTGILKTLGNILPHNDSIDQGKKKIEDRLSLIRRRVVIFVDDIDRMKGDELMEVFKLIRLTANFKNVIFIVAYDKVHVIEQMKSVDIENGAEFLKKVFHLEITLPYVEQSVLSAMFMQEMKECRFDDDFMDTIRKQLSRKKQDGNTIISGYIKNFRDVKNFINSLIVGYELLKDIKEEVLYRDFFWVEVIRSYLPEVYEIMSNEPQSILDIDKREMSGGYMYSYYSFSEENDKLPMEKKDKERLKKKLIDRYGHEFEQIMLIMFWERYTNSLSIKRFNNYYKYFEYRMPDNVISNQGFEHLMSLPNKSKLREQIKKYNHEKKTESLIRHLYHFRCSECKEASLMHNYFVAIVEVGNYYNTEKMCEIYRNAFIGDKKGVDTSFVYELIEETLDSDDCRFLNWNKLLVYIYEIRRGYDGDELYENECVLTDEQIKGFVIKNFDNYINSLDSLPNISEITRESSTMNEFVKNACVTQWFYPEPEISEKTNLIFDSLIKYYSQHSENQNKEAFMNPFKIDEYGYNIEEIKEKKEILFGSVEMFDEFVRKCFPRN